ncbi:MAG: flavin reductase family protein, partial [Actinomycetota bacterium]|nr:flavin reductase family protein [Actinomycetota bacterium]
MENDLERTISEISSHLDYPMFIVTASNEDEIAGCLVGFVTQCSISPARFAVWISKQNHTHRVAMESDLLTVHVVPSDAEELARLFGEETGDEIDKFARVAWSRHRAGGVVIEGVGDWFSGSVL